MARPTILTPDVHARIVQALRAGSYLREAAALVGVGERTVYQWIEKGETALDAHDNTVPTEDPAWVYAEFAQAVMEARAAAKVEAVAMLREAIRGRAAEFDDEGNLVRSEVKPDWRPALEFLARTDSEHWGRVNRFAGRIEVVTEDTIDAEIRRLEAELEDRSAPGEAPATP